MIKSSLFQTAVLSTALLGLSAPVSAAWQQIAGDIVGDPLITYEAPDDAWGDEYYENTSMWVNWQTNDDIEVRVYTGYENRDWANHIKYGDLFIGTGEKFNLYDNSEENWKYAFHLGRRSENPDPSELYPNKGWLIEHDGYGLVPVYDDGIGDRDGVGVTARHDTPGHPVAGHLGEGTWYQQDRYNNAITPTEDFVTFSFNVANLGNPTQLAFRWAMTCANDVIRGIAHKPPGTVVSEPAVAALMLFGLVGIGISRRRQNDNRLRA